MSSGQINEALKINAIVLEVEASYAHITDGIRYLNTQKSPVLNNHVLLQNFASGFERLIKILLLIKEKYTTGDFPQTSEKYFRKYRNGHGIKEMLDELIKYSKTVDLMQSVPIVASDIEYLESDVVFIEIINLLSDFAHKHRYDYIDTILLVNPLENVEHKTPFDRFRTVVYSFSAGKDLSLLTEKEEERANVQETIISIEKGVRGLVRFFTHGFGDEGRKFYGEYSSFIILDKDFGKLAYLKAKHDSQTDYFPITKKDEKYNSILKASRIKKLTQEDYSDWAFNTFSLRVLNMDNKFYLVEIDGEIFALNGWAVTYFEIPIYFASRH